jgi:DNA-binding MarR family transcriptional regulator
LLNNQLIEQTDDLIDRRSKRLLITEKGKGVLFGTFDEMRKASFNYCGYVVRNRKNAVAVFASKTPFFP